MTDSPYGQQIDGPAEFMSRRDDDISNMSKDTELQEKALQLQVAANGHRYGYQQLWCGVPVIRLPDDIVLLQEIVHAIQPECIVETGIARGGSLLLNASLMEICGLVPKVLGIDIMIYPHAKTALGDSKYSEAIELVEADSTSASAQLAFQRFTQQANSKNPVLLVLDSNHTHAHVLSELKMFTPALPIGSVVVVADTIIAEMPETLYSDRPWGIGNNPLTAVTEFLSGNTSYVLHNRWAKRGLLSELHDGILVRVK